MEEVLSHFLEEKEVVSKNTSVSEEKESKATMGISVSKLAEELMLEEEQVERLLSIFMKKMEESLIELESAIQKRDYKVINHLAHSIKGSSSNFRIEALVSLAYELEKAAYQEDVEFEFEKIYEEIAKTFKTLKS